jgi:hypothetical protein
MPGIAAKNAAGKSLAACHDKQFFRRQCVTLYGQTEAGKTLLSESYENLKAKLGENHEQTHLCISKNRKILSGG